MTNDEAVEEAVWRAVCFHARCAISQAVSGAVDRAVNRDVNLAGYVAVDSAVWWAVDGAVGVTL